MDRSYKLANHPYLSSKNRKSSEETEDEGPEPSGTEGRSQDGLESTAPGTFFFFFKYSLLERQAQAGSLGKELPVAVEPTVTAAPKKRARKTAEQWTSQLRSRRSMRVKYPTTPKGDTAGSIFAVGADPDHPPDQQTRASPQAHE